MVRLSKILIPLMTLAVLAGCATPAPYAPRGQGQATGYTDRELATGRYRVTFTGNSVTSRETVENFLLLRAAEVARAAGSEYFMFDSRDTRADTRYTALPDAYPDAYPGPGWGRGGYWRFRPRWGWGVGWGYGPADVDIVTTTRYQAYAEIVLLTSEQAQHEPRALKSSDIISHLGPDAAPPPRSPA